MKSAKRCLMMAAWVLAGLLVGFAAVTLARGQAPCGREACDCGCAGGGACLRCAAAKWVLHPGDPDQLDLWDGARQLGAWDVFAQRYLPREGDGWGAECAPPVEVPGRFRRVRNFGVEREKFSAVERYSVNGREVAREEALGPPDVAGPSPAPPDDAGKPWVVWVGDEATGEQVRAAVGDRARVQSYRPGEAMVRDRTGQQTLYSPGLWFVAPSGQARREERYTGPEQLMEGLRQAAAGWEPAKAPPLDGPDLAPVIGGATSLPLTGLGASGALTALALGIVHFARKARGA